MKVVILAGGLGTRLSEETQLIPKPMVEIGGRPILWHIMKIYSHFGYNDFVILTGYKSHVIKNFFVNYYQRYSDITVDMAKNTVEVHRNATEPWKVTMLYTGESTMTGGRIKRAEEYIGGWESLRALSEKYAIPWSTLEAAGIPGEDLLSSFREGNEDPKLKEALDKISNTKVEDIMVRTVLTTSPDDSIMSLLKSMVNMDVSRVPVVDRGVLLGIVSRSDITFSLYKMKMI